MYVITEAILTGLVLIYFKTTQCEIHFKTNLMKILSPVTEILSFLGFVLFSITADVSHLGMPNCKKNHKNCQKTMERALWEFAFKLGN